MPKPNSYETIDSEDSIDAAEALVDAMFVPKTFKDLIDANPQEIIAHMMMQEGVQTFEEDFMAWQELLSQTEDYDDDEVARQLLEARNAVQLPNSEKGDIYAQYYTIVNTMKFLYSLHKPVHSRCEVLEDAIKSLKGSARGMFKGTEKDKDAHCVSMVRYMALEYTKARNLLNAIDEAISFVDFAAVQASRVLKEREYALKVTGQALEQGKMNIHNRATLAEEMDGDDDDDPVPARFRK